jgi:hypothetical protein
MIRTTLANRLAARTPDEKPPVLAGADGEMKSNFLPSEV